MESIITARTLRANATRPFEIICILKSKELLFDLQLVFLPAHLLADLG